MNKELVDRKNKEYKENYERRRDYAIEEIKHVDFLTEDEKVEAINLLNEWKGSDTFVKLTLPAVMNRKTEWLNDLDLFKLDHFEENYYSIYLDSEPQEFDGDIIITDPCYFIKEKERVGEYPFINDFLSYEREEDYPDYSPISDEDFEKLSKLDKLIKMLEFDKDKICISKQYKEEYRNYQNALKEYKEINKDDWDLCCFGEKMGVLGFKNYMIRNTIYGDWSCTTFNTDTKEELGHFCADAGMVGVFLLNEVLKYNKEFDYHIEKPWTTTLIKDFKGTVQFVIKEINTIKSSKNHVSYEVEVVGHGFNKRTGEPINFIGTQTGL